MMLILYINYSQTFGLNQTLRELKMDGKLVSRHLSLNGVKTILHEGELVLKNEFCVIYNRACQLVSKKY